MYQYIPDPFVNWCPTRPPSLWQRFTRRIKSVRAHFNQTRRTLRGRYRRWLNGGIDGEWVWPLPVSRLELSQVAAVADQTPFLGIVLRVDEPRGRYLAGGTPACPRD